jgi:hypothetical protein
LFFFFPLWWPSRYRFFYLFSLSYSTETRRL